MTRHSRHQALSTTAPPGDTRLETLRRQYQREITDSAAHHGRPVRVAPPYVLAAPGAGRHTDLQMIEAHARRLGRQVTRSTFADIGQVPALTQRSGFDAACRYAGQGFAHGIVANNRAAITTHNDAYAHVLHHLHLRGVFLTYLPALPRLTPRSRRCLGRAPAPPGPDQAFGTGGHRRWGHVLRVPQRRPHRQTDHIGTDGDVLFVRCDRLPEWSCRCRAGRRAVGSDEARPPVTTVCPAGAAAGPGPSRAARLSRQPTTLRMSSAPAVR
ncbi:hypothetical protein [Streptomyces sp. Tue6028]|uniref:hypothetical protein n=1 Tax=Streptomyces sp. Tue6028 TaxID=2036037 RepID=UPI003D75FCAD